jgi:endonuclease/exonuclease/phosphatase family metal-dependent hydrolase
LKYTFFLFYVLLVGLNVQAQNHPVFNKLFINTGAAGMSQYTPSSKIIVSIPASSLATTFVTQSPFQISTDSILFSSSIMLPGNSNTVNQNLFVRLLVNDADTIFKASIKAIKGINDTATNFVSLFGSSYITDSFYSVLSWNCLWFGDASNCNCNVTEQYNNVTDFLTSMQPDVIALQEIVDANAIATISSTIGNNYEYTVGEFGSFADDAQDVDYAECQKLAFIYNAKIFNKLSAYPFSKNTNQSISNTGYYFSSGRYPYLMHLTEKPSGQPLSIMNLHAKAGTTQSDFTRRSLGAVAIRDSVFAQYYNQPFILVGDYNDKLEGSITSNTYSPYYYILNTAMTGLSLPSVNPNKTTYVWNSSIIDNICINSNSKQSFGGTFTIMDELAKVYLNYGNTTSDHYPILAYFRRNFQTPVTVSNSYIDKVEIVPSFQKIIFKNPNMAVLKIQIFNVAGQIIKNIITTDAFFSVEKPVNQELLIVKVHADKSAKVFKW